MFDVLFWSPSGLQEWNVESGGSGPHLVDDSSLLHQAGLDRCWPCKMWSAAERPMYELE